MSLLSSIVAAQITGRSEAVQGKSGFVTGQIYKGLLTKDKQKTMRLLLARHLVMWHIGRTFWLSF
jgi:hypothetical protein